MPEALDLFTFGRTLGERPYPVMMLFQVYLVDEGNDMSAFAKLPYKKDTNIAVWP